MYYTSLTLESLSAVSVGGKGKASERSSIREAGGVGELHHIVEHNRAYWSMVRVKQLAYLGVYRSVKDLTVTLTRRRILHWVLC